MEMYYVSKGINNYIEVNVGEALSEGYSSHCYRLQMLKNNDIEGLIRPVFLELDGSLTLKYNTCSCYVLDRLFLKLKPDGSFLRILLNQLEALLYRLKEFLLEPDDVVLKPEYMFYNWGEKALKLIYIPGYGVSIKTQLKSFLEYIMRIFDHRDEDGVRYMYGMYDLVSEDTFSMDDFRLGHECEYPYVSDYLETGGEINSSGIAEMRGGGRESKCDYNAEEPDMKAVKNNMESSGGSAFSRGLRENRLSEKPITKLVPLTSGALKEITLSKYQEMILVGRGKRETDYRIPTTQISRVHACIYLRDNGIFVEDRESTNGTFVNSVRLEPLKQEQIKVGDLVNFANEEFFAV